MKIADIYKSKSLTTSFEVFPPNDKVGLEQVYNCLDVLSLEKPDYISVTYGAGGNTKGRTVEINIFLTLLVLLEDLFFEVNFSKKINIFLLKSLLKEY